MNYSTLQRGMLLFGMNYSTLNGVCSTRVVAFQPAEGMFIFTKRFPVTPTRNHNHPQLGCITPTDGRVKGVS